MNVKELRLKLIDMPDDSEIVVCKDIKGAWTLINDVQKTHYRSLTITCLMEGV